jgi:hypothetical protein
VFDLDLDDPPVSWPWALLSALADLAALVFALAGIISLAILAAAAVGTL